MDRRRFLKTAAGLFVPAAPALILPASAQGPILPGPGLPAAAAWTPANLSNLLIWLDASDSVTVIRSGSNVSAWNDKSGNGNNFAGAGSGAQPQYSATSFPGSKPGITSSANNYIRRTGQSLNSATMSAFVVFSLTAVGGFLGILSIQGASGGNDFNQADSVSFSTGNATATTSVDRGGSPAYAATRTITTGSARSGGYIFNGTQGVTYGDFVGTTAANSSTAAFGNTTANILPGARQNSGGTINNHLTGVISEVIITTGVMSGGDLSSLQAYWTAKWGTP